MSGITLKPSDPLYKVIISTPSFVDNPVGILARSALANCLKQYLPGRHSEFLRTGALFRDIFFPGYSSVQYESDVPSVTNLSSSFWANFSVAVLCQSIYWQTSNARNNVNIGKVNGDVSSYNNQVKSQAVTWYAHVMLKDFMKYSGNFASAKTEYMQQLNSDHWVMAKRKQWSDGTWNNPDWELFHHWVKLSALGASDSEISSLIASLKGKGLPIQSDVDANAWRNYLPWYSPQQLDHKDMDSDARGGELKSAYIPSYSMYGTGTWMAEENSYEFLANSQPGGKYNQPPPSSCFSSTTKILMSDNSLKFIKDVKVGDLVKTPSGSAKVLMVSTPKIGNRSMYRINDLSFCFTDGHPFVSYANSPHYVSLSPIGLLNIPFIGHDGIGQLQKGTELISHKGSKVTVMSLESPPLEKSESFVYDLIIDPSEDGTFEYFAGDETCMFTVASELSTIKEYTKSELLAFQVILKVIFDSAPLLNKLYDSIEHQNFLMKLQAMALQIKSSLLPNAIHSNSDKKFDEDVTKFFSISLDEVIRITTKSFQSSDGTYNQACGAAYDFFMKMLFYPIASLIELGYRTTPKINSLEYLAVSIMEFHVLSTVPTLDSSIVKLYVPNQSLEPLCKRKDKTEGENFGQRFHQIYYVPLRDATKSLDVLIEIFSPVQTKKHLLKARLFVQPSVRYGCSHQRLPLFDANNVEQGYINVDTRILAAEHLDLEIGQASAWNDEKREKLALRIAEAFKDSLANLCKSRYFFFFFFFSKGTLILIGLITSITHLNTCI